jgi:hypothetical protein
MANQSPPKITPITSTTKRGFATASCCLGIWGLLICWWYPLWMAFASFGVLFGIISVIMGYRAGKDGEHLAWAGIGFGMVAVSLAFAMYRFMQLAFEGSIAAPWMPVIVMP